MNKIQLIINLIDDYKKNINKQDIFLKNIIKEHNKYKEKILNELIKNINEIQ